MSREAHTKGEGLKGTKSMGKKQIVRMLLEIMSKAENVPTKADNTIDMEKFGQTPETQALLTFFKILGVDAEYLRDKGFMVAYILYAQYMK